jgi:hypothetical protein
MASELIGRTACPECGFHAAHVKIKTDKPDARPYRHCPECSAQYFTRSAQQADNLRRQIRSGTEMNIPPAQVLPEPELPAPAEAAKPQRFKTVFGVKVPLEDNA